MDAVNLFAGKSAVYRQSRPGYPAECFDYLLENIQVVGTPGAGFGENGKNYFRLTSFGTYENTSEAMKRFEELFAGKN